MVKPHAEFLMYFLYILLSICLFIINFAKNMKLIYTFMIEPGISKTISMVVTESDTALHMRSGDMCVLATPSMIALMEQAAMKSVELYLPEGTTTVGCMIESTHLYPSCVGAEISAQAILERIEGRKLYFSIEAKEGEKLLGSGKHTRVIVDRKRFMEKL